MKKLLNVLSLFVSACLLFSMLSCAPAAELSAASDGKCTVYVNQIGYDCGKSKRATFPLTADGTEFCVVNAETGEVAYKGTVSGNIADFTDLDTEKDTDFYITCNGAKSYTFTIGRDIIYRRSVSNALKFMNETRSDTFCVGQNSVAWRDSHQFSFELNGLVMQYMSNPSVYDNMPMSIVNASDCEYEELRVQDEPDIVWLIQFAALRYYDWGHNDGLNLHALTKEQLAYFLYVYPMISDYVDSTTYTNIRDYAISVWGVNAVSSNCQWYAVSDTNHDLYSVQTAFGGLKGSQPPGHSIVPNLMMYEVALRDRLGEDVAQRFFTAAYENCEYVINGIDLNDPFYSKGQRMSEYVTVTALSYFLEMYPDKAPSGLKEALVLWADKTVARSDNMWDMRMAASMAAGDSEYTFHNPNMTDVNLSKDYWTGAAYANDDKQSEYLAGGAPRNEPGNLAGFQAVTYSVERVLGNGETNDRLKALGVAAIDDLYGRNPTGMAAFYNFTRDFEGADAGWYTQYNGGAGVLGGCTAVLDANAPESCYPYSPENYNTGYTEGWVAYNSAWNMSLAYSSADSVSLSVADSGYAGEKVSISLEAPLNLDSKAVEYGYVIVTNNATGETEKVKLSESGESSSIFTGEYTLPNVSSVTVSYGYGLFEKSTAISINTTETVPVGLKLTAPNTVSSYSESVRLSATGVIFSDGSVQTDNLPDVTFESSNISVLRVNSYGDLYPVSNGSATVTATVYVDNVKVTGSAVINSNMTASYDFLECYRNGDYSENGVTLEMTENTDDSITETYGKSRIKLYGNKAGNTVSFNIDELPAGKYSVVLYSKFYGGSWKYGSWSFKLGDSAVGSVINFDDSAKNGKYYNVDLGTVTISDTADTFTFVSEDGGSLVPVSVEITPVSVCYGNGDADKNGVVNSEDLLVLQSHMLGIDVMLCDTVYADIDRNAIIDSKDLECVALKLLGISL